MKEPLNVIHVEDIAADSELIEHLLRDNGYDCRLYRVETRGQLLSALEHQPCDVVLSDCTLPQFSGLEALREVHGRKPQLPFIFVSGTIGEEIAIKSLQQGATDYVLKHRLSRLVPAVRRALAEAEARKLHRAMEEQLRQARKLEAVGLLASGLAHDFRNLLQILHLSLTLLPLKANNPAEVAKLGEQMGKTVDRGTEMVKELLSFARKSESRLAPVDLGALVREIADLLAASLPENIHLQANLREGLPQILADAGQVDRMLTNLMVNARDAMPGGGILTLTTDLAHLESVPGEPAGRRSYLRVTRGPTPAPAWTRRRARASSSRSSPRSRWAREPAWGSPSSAGWWRIITASSTCRRSSARGPPSRSTSPCRRSTPPRRKSSSSTIPSSSSAPSPWRSGRCDLAVARALRARGAWAKASRVFTVARSATATTAS
ncbi:MAG: response regulator [Verrucomicrobiota bacterium]